MQKRSIAVMPALRRLTNKATLFKAHTLQRFFKNFPKLPFKH